MRLLETVSMTVLLWLEDPVGLLLMKNGNCLVKNNQCWSFICNAYCIVRVSQSVMSLDLWRNATQEMFVKKAQKAGTEGWGGSSHGLDVSLRAVEERDVASSVKDSIRREDKRDLCLVVSYWQEGGWAGRRKRQTGYHKKSKFSDPVIPGETEAVGTSKILLREPAVVL